MRIAVTSESGNASGMATHFGRCVGFAIFESTGGKIASERSVKNPYCGAHKPGAVPRFIISQKVEVVITEGAGPNAIGALESAGIQVVFAHGKARDLAKQYIEGKLGNAENVCRH
jgi:predicted Fe-Mo cluster-binding NifX family protein